MEPSKWIWMDGELTPWDDARVHVMAFGLQYGAGVFEGIRCHQTDRGPAVFRLPEHVRRLRNSARVYLTALPYSDEALIDAAGEVIRANGIGDCYLRPFAWLGEGPEPFGAPVHVAIACGRWDAYLGADAAANGVRAKVASFRRIDPNVIPPAAKAAGQYLNSFLAKIEAVTSGYDEAILLNTAGRVSDGSAENVFVVRDGTLVTPPTSAGALAGITRHTVMTLAADAGIDVVQEDLVRTDLYLADEAFFTGTAAGVVPIASVDDRAPTAGVPGPITTVIGERYEAAVRGRDERHADWLHPVDP